MHVALVLVRYGGEPETESDAIADEDERVLRAMTEGDEEYG